MSDQADFAETAPYLDCTLHQQTLRLPLVERIELQDELMGVAKQLWEGFALWIGDPDAARLELRNDSEIMRQVG